MRSISRKPTPDSIAYVYLLLDPRDKTPFYVGKTEHPTARITGHITDGRKCRIIGAGTKASIIKEILESGFEPIMRIIEITTNRYVGDREFWWYETLKNRGYKVTGEVTQSRVTPAPIYEPLNVHNMPIEAALQEITSKSARKAIVYTLVAYWDQLGISDFDRKALVEDGEKYIEGGV